MTCLCCPFSAGVLLPWLCCEWGGPLHLPVGSGSGLPLGLLSVLAPTLSSSGCPWDMSGSDFSQRCSSAVVQTLIDASLFNNFFSGAVLLN